MTYPDLVKANAITQMAVAALIPYAKNARTHTDEQVRQIANSIAEFGFNNPVLVDGEGTIIAGHGRVMAAQSLNLEKIPCVVLNHLTDEQRRAYIIADNRIAESSEWDMDLLSAEMADLGGVDIDLALLGFDAAEIKDFAGDVSFANMPELQAGDRMPFQQMSFTLHDDQAAAVKEALAQAIAAGSFEGSSNENSNGNALARICEAYLGR